MKPTLSLESLSYEVFDIKFKAWCVEKKIVTDDEKLQVLPTCVDDKILAPLVPKFRDDRTTIKTALEALRDEYNRQTRPANPQEEFSCVKTSLPSETIRNCEYLNKMASYLHLGDNAVKQRLLDSLPHQLQSSLVVWLSSNPNSSSRDMANFVSTFPDSLVQQSVATAKTVTKRVCAHCQKEGHSKEKCYQLRTCWNCQKTGHLAKFCKASKNV